MADTLGAKPVEAVHEISAIAYVSLPQTQDS
jgi:hypothetical protein